MSPAPGDPPTAREVVALIESMSIAERTLLFAELDGRPQISQDAGYVVFPVGMAILLDRLRKSAEEMSLKATETAVELDVKVQNRNRQSSPEIIRRNVEICDLRRANKKKWSLSRLGSKYHITRQTVVRILSEEDKWRRQAAKL